MELAAKIYKEMLYFQDLTCSALLLSNAIEPKTAPDKVWISFCGYCRKKLHKKLKKYQKESFWIEKLGIDNRISKKVLKEIQIDYRYSEVRNALVEEVFKVKSEENLTLKKAAIFFRKTRILQQSKNKNTYQQWEIDIQMLESKGSTYKELISGMTQAQKAMLCLDAYTRLAHRAVTILEDYVSGVLFVSALQVFRDSCS